jgi:hypothetical protein
MEKHRRSCDDAECMKFYSFHDTIYQDLGNSRHSGGKKNSISHTCVDVSVKQDHYCVLSGSKWSARIWLGIAHGVDGSCEHDTRFIDKKRRPQMLKDGKESRESY